MTVQEAADYANCSLLVSASKICQSSRQAGVQLEMRDALLVLRAAVDGMLGLVSAEQRKVVPN